MERRPDRENEAKPCTRPSEPCQRTTGVRAGPLDPKRTRARARPVPDPWTARRIVLQVRSLAPHVPIVARSRYHVHRWQLIMAGADAVVDEEDEVGVRIAEEVRLRVE